MCECMQNSGLGAITGRPVHVGAPFELGVELGNVLFATEVTRMPTLLTEIESKLAASGYISGLIRAYQLSGTINPFIVIAGGSGREYGSDLHLRDAVLSVLDGVMKGIGSNINYASVTFTAETYDPQTGQTTVSTTPAPRDTVSGGVGGTLDQVGQTLGGWFATDSQTGLIIGGIGLLGLVLLLKRL